MTRIATVLAVLLAGCQGSETGWQCCDFYGAVSSTPVDGGREIRFKDCDGISEFTCFVPGDPSYSDQIQCHDDAGNDVPFTKQARGC